MLKNTDDFELDDCGTDVGRPEAAQDHLFHVAETGEQRQRERAILDAAKPCPLCGSSKLTVEWWCLDDGDVEAIECMECYAGAPWPQWQTRNGV